MPRVNVTINGRAIAVQAGQTVLEAAEQAGVDIPTLCHHPALQPIGACRMCLVEIARQRGLQAACTLKVVEGMEVETESPAVVAARKFMLQLLFSERNHFCMYCEMSGDCELQDLAYRYGLDQWTYGRAFPKLEVDSSHPYFVTDPNRCVLCRRCVRACEEVVGNHTLGVRERGANSMICADLNVPLGESSCVSCGTCVQVCPTGSLVDRKSAYLAFPGEGERVRSGCSFCSLGCGVELVTSHNHLIRIESDWDAVPNEGLLCVKGRYEPLDEQRTRVLAPMVRRNGLLKQVGWDEALQLVADSISGLEGRLAGLASPRLTNEALSFVARLFRERLHSRVGSLVEVPECLLQPEGNLAVLDYADLFVVMAADLTLDHQVAGFVVKRGVTNRGAHLILIDEEANGLRHYAAHHLKPGESARAIALCTAAAQPAVIYGAGAGSDLRQLRIALSGKAHFLGLVPGANSRGALAAGINGLGEWKDARGFYVLAGDDQVSEELIEPLEGADFVAVHSSYLTPLVARADVVLPAAIWSEKAGHFINTEGRVLELAGAVDPPPGVKSDEEILELLAAKLNVTP